MNKSFSKKAVFPAALLTLGGGRKTYDFLTNGELYNAVPAAGFTIMSACITAAAVMTIFERPSQTPPSQSTHEPVVE